MSLTASSKKRVVREEYEDGLLILSHMTTREGESGKYLGGTTCYAVKSKCLVMLRKCKEHKDCYVLVELGPRKVDMSEQTLLSFYGEPSGKSG